MAVENWTYRYWVEALSRAQQRHLAEMDRSRRRRRIGLAVGFVLYFGLLVLNRIYP